MARHTKLGWRDFHLAVVSRLPRMQLGQQRENHRLLKGGSNQTADTRLAVRARGKIGDKCLVMRLRFAVIREFCF